jgi:CRISPR system Cascade subunit CasC
MVKLIATVSPGAKLGSTAPHAYAHMVLAEAGNAQPRTLANAFLNPITTSPRQPDPVAAAYRALAQHAADLDRMYGPAFQRRLAAIGPADGLADALRATASASLAEVAGWAADQVRGG